MSRLGRKPIVLPAGVSVSVAEKIVTVQGKGGKLMVKELPYLSITPEANSITVSATATDAQARANWGTMVALLKNAIAGVTEGFSKNLEIQGVGFRATIEGKDLVLSVGFTHPVRFRIPEGITLTVEKSILKLSGIDKALVGETAATIRRIKKPEPYKGKGIRYVGEVVRRKAGKKVAGTTA